MILSPFLVTAEEDEGYRATSTLAGTKIRTELKDVGSAITVVTKDFLNDTGAVDNESLLRFTPSTEVAGLDGNYGVAGTAQGFAEVLLRTDANTRVRGLATADNTRNFFISEIPWDAYNVDRVEVQRGPNAILYGLGKPGGLINSSLAQAQFKDRDEVRFRVGSFASARTTADFNHQLLKNELALRLCLLYDAQNYRQRPAYKDDHRQYVALRYDPRILNRREIKTSLRVNFESGEIDSNNPRPNPPVDRFTPWFQTGTTTVNGVTYNNLNRQTFDFRYWTSYLASIPRSGWMTRTSPHYQPALGTTYGGLHAYFADNSGFPAGSYYVSQAGYTLSGGRAANGNRDGTIGGLWPPAARAAWVGTAAEIAVNQRVPFAAAYVNSTLTDSTIFDFYNNLLDGPNKQERRHFNSLNLALNQTYFRNRLGFEVTGDWQEYEDFTNTMLTSVDPGITIDVNELLPNGTSNPNIGRPVIYNRSYFGSGGADVKRGSLRATGFAEFRAADFMGRSWLTKLIGRHVFTANASRDKVEKVSRRWASSAVEGSTSLGLIPGAINPQREILYTIYLGPDLRGRSSAAGAGIGVIKSVLVPTSGTLVGFDSTWKSSANPATQWFNTFTNTNSTQSENPANYVGWTRVPAKILRASAGDRDALVIVAGKSKDEVRSEVLVWQGYFFDGLVVPTLGYRRDTADSYAATAPLGPQGYRLQDHPSYVFNRSPDATVEGSSNSFSVVMHTPRALRERLPGRLNLSLFYSQSENFEPAAGRVDMLNRPLGAPTGETKDFGVSFSLFDERVTVKASRYKSGATGSSFFFSNHSFVGNIESRAWVSAKRFEAGLSGDPRYAGAEYNYGSTVDGAFVQTAQDRVDQARDVAAVLAALRPEIGPAWNITFDDFRWQSGAYEPWANGLPGFQPPGMCATSDSESEGYEFELLVKPVSNWDIMINASKTTAARSNIGGTAWRAWIDQRNTVWNGAGGNLRTTSGVTSDTYRQQWNTNFYNNYALQLRMENALAWQMRPWRFNLVSNYRFVAGRLKGCNLGGAYRWEDKVATGYPSVMADINGTLLESVDVSHPYFGPTTSTVDLWAGYQRQISRKFRWRVQLNVTNALGRNELIPVNVQPDGSPGTFRIRQGPTWTCTNTFTF